MHAASMERLHDLAPPSLIPAIAENIRLYISLVSFGQAYANIDGF